MKKTIILTIAAAFVIGWVVGIYTPRIHYPLVIHHTYASGYSRSVVAYQVVNREVNYRIQDYYRNHGYGLDCEPFCCIVPTSNGFNIIIFSGEIGRRTPDDLINDLEAWVPARLREVDQSNGASLSGDIVPTSESASQVRQASLAALVER